MLLRCVWFARAFHRAPVLDADQATAPQTKKKAGLVTGLQEVVLRGVLAEQASRDHLRLNLGRTFKDVQDARVTQDAADLVF